MSAQEFIQDFLDMGYTLEQISAAVSDGELLGFLNMTQYEAEEIYNLIKETKNENTI